MVDAFGADPIQAVTNYALSLRQAMHCITQAPITARGFEPGRLHTLTFPSNDMVPLVRSGNQSRLMLTCNQHYRLIETSDAGHGPWNINVVGYMYTLHDRDGHEIVSYHWHPNQTSPVTWPHLHMGVAAIGEGASVSRRDLPGIHFPTRFIPPQDIIRLAITQLDVRPLRNEWEQILRETDRN